MKYYLQLMEDLKQGNISPVNLFYGPEVYLRDKAIDSFKEKLLEAEMAGFNFDLLEGREVPASQVVGIARTPPVMGKYRLVVVKRAPYFGSGEPGEILEYIRSPLNTTCLILDTETVDRRKKLFKEISKQGNVVEFSRLSNSDLSKWINQLARRNKKKISPHGVELLLSRCGREMYIIYNEIKKLVNYTDGEESITEEDIRFVVCDKGEENIFAVVDALGNKEYSKALEGINSMLLRKESPQAILGMLSRQVRLILQASELHEKGYSVKDMSKFMGTPNFVCKKALAQSRNFSRKKLVYMLKGILDVDEQVKTGKMNFYPAMEMFFLECG